MLRLYRSGLLEPYYKNGTQSRAREHMLMYSESCILESEALDRITTLRTMLLAPHIDTKKIGTFLKEILHYAAFSADKSEFTTELFKTLEEQLVSHSTDMRKVFKTLEENGIIEAFKNAIKNKEKNH